MILELTIFINNQIIIMADIQLQVGAGNKQTNFTLYDSVTGQPIVATFSNQQIVSNSNPTAANFAIPTGNPNMVIGQPLASGSGVMVASATASYTDPGDGQTKTGSFSVTKNFTVLGAAHGATMDLPFA